MIKAEKWDVKMNGSVPELLCELGLITEGLHDAIKKKTGKDVGTEILELVAFSLCTTEEKEEVLKDKMKRMVEK